MKNKHAIFFFSFLMFFMPFHMKGMEIVTDTMKDVASFLNKHSGAVFMASLGVLVVLSYDEVADSEDDDLFNCVVKKQKLDKFELLKNVKKTSEHSQILVIEEVDNREPSAMDILSWGLLWSIGSQLSRMGDTRYS